MKALVIKNLFLGFTEFATKHLARIQALLDANPDCECIVIAGNISSETKRSLLFAEEVSKLTPLPVLFGLGIAEYSTLAKLDLVKTATTYRLRSVKSNVVYIDDFDHPLVEFKAVFGAPLIHCTDQEWKATLPGRRLVMRVGDFYIGDELASRFHPFNFSVAEFNAMFETEKPEWTGKKRILLSAISESNDPYFTMKYTPPRIECDVRLDHITDQFSVVVF
jgi:hypothetical protein